MRVMRIRTLSLIVIGLFLILFFFFIQFFMTPALLDEANEFDEKVLDSDVSRVSNYLTMESDNLMRQNIDWSMWDDTYFFVNNQSDSYISDNLENDVLLNNRIQMIIYLDSQGSIFHSHAIDENGESTSVSSSFLERVTQLATDGEDVFFESLDGIPVLLASHPITRNDRTGESGLLLMGRIINEDYLQTLAESLSLDVALASPERDAFVSSQDKISADHMIEDVNQNTIIPLNIAADRFFYHEKQANLFNLKILVSVVLLSLASLFYFFFKSFVLDPVKRLAAILQESTATNTSESQLSGPFNITATEINQIELEFKQMITNIQLANEEITEMAYHDQLTKLRNRFYLTKKFDEFVNQDTRKRAVVFFDLDGFKKVNDIWGHEVGDLLLKKVAKRLKRHFKDENTIIARVGGDEFSVILPFEEKEAMLIQITEMRGELAQAFRLGSITVSISASVGISMYPDDGDQLSGLIKKADEAMYESKARGKNQLTLYQDLLVGSAFTKVETLKKDAQFVLENNQLHLVFQPIFKGENPLITGVEALLRWNHPKFGSLSPDLFIDLFEETGVINEIGIWVLKEGISKLSMWHRSGHRSLSLSFNFSKTQLQSYQAFLDELDKALKETNVAPSSIIIEITESEVSYYDNELMHFIKEIQKRNVKIAFDDFGKGSTSLSGLRKHPVDVVKIDRSFMESIPFENFNASLLTGICTLLNQLNIEIIAEGIENEAQFKFLLNHPGIKMQGYYFSKPITPEAVTELLSDMEGNQSKLV
ncbi:EAL domain-containing protein [Paenalkalicoccus suaedae]|uniref:EAL domain-containing protein n=1 Tax=Paenalkalicoccus suaedae TaxID=2592382 RepID=A0A859FIQ3_9BACI|nr:EAL domain-containing protein [Paenalkalicoccus suaedae]QKS72582.1 EAL domain-containing protein [Paenalkalicoccus suaedae]